MKVKLKMEPIINTKIVYFNLINWAKKLNTHGCKEQVMIDYKNNNVILFLIVLKKIRCTICHHQTYRNY